METFLKKRTGNINGIARSVYIPAFEKDVEIAGKIPDNEIVSADIKVNRKQKSNRGNWAIVKFFIDSMPEYIAEHIGEYRAGSEYFVREWLKVEIGYCEILKIRGEKYLIPKKSDARSLPDELEYIEQVKKPMDQYIARAMGFDNVYELYQASIKNENV